MPNESKTESRVRESWRARACAAGLCVGAQIFLMGTGSAMPIALSSAWIASLAALPCAALVTAICHRALRTAKREGAFSRGLYLLLALTLLANAVFAAAALTDFAQQTLLPQNRAIYTAALISAALLLCALPGGAGVCRLSFALRYALPALLCVLTLASIPLKTPAGLFPLLGAGPLPLGLAALCMPAASSVLLMLLLPPPEIEEAGEEAMRCPAPELQFFLRRVLLGAGMGVLLLFAVNTCTTYEAIAQSGEWGTRLRMICSGQPHEGIPQMLLTVLQAAAMGLLAANMLSAGEQALVRAIPRAKRRRAGLAAMSLFLFLLLALLAANGMDGALFAAPLLAVPATVLLIFHRRLGTA